MGSLVVPLVSRFGRPVAIAAVVELITIGGTALGPSHRGGRPFDLVALPLIVLAAGATAFARAWPVPALAVALAGTVAYFGLGYPIDSSFFVGLTVTAYLSASAGGRLRAAVFAALTAVLFVAAPLAGRTRESIQSGFGEAVIVIAALVAGQVAAEWRARAGRQAAQAHEEESLRRLAEERLRIARELHDVVSHSIAMISVQAGVAVHVMDERPEEARAALVAIKAVSRDALRDLRGILGLLRQTDDAEPRSPAGGLAQMPELAENVRRAGVPVTVSVEADGTPLPASIDLAAYRVVQEALTNVVRHAPGAAAAVTVRRRPGSLLVEVVDDGPGAPLGAPVGAPVTGAGHGLAGMRERVRAAGGSVEAGPRPDGGFAVRATLPLETEPA